MCKIKLFGLKNKIVILFLFLLVSVNASGQMRVYYDEANSLLYLQEKKDTEIKNLDTMILLNMLRGQTYLIKDSNLYVSFYTYFDYFKTYELQIYSINELGKIKLKTQRWINMQDYKMVKQDEIMIRFINLGLCFEFKNGAIKYVVISPEEIIKIGFNELILKVLNCN